MKVFIMPDFRCVLCRAQLVTTGEFVDEIYMYRVAHWENPPSTCPQQNESFLFDPDKNEIQR